MAEVRGLGREPIRAHEQYYNRQARGVFRVKVAKYIGCEHFRKLSEECNVGLVQADKTAKAWLDQWKPRDPDIHHAWQLAGAIVSQTGLKAIILYPENNISRPRSIYFVGDPDNLKVMEKIAGNADIIDFNSPFRPETDPLFFDEIMRRESQTRCVRREARVEPDRHNTDEMPENVRVALDDFFSQVTGYVPPEIDAPVEEGNPE